MFRLRNKKLNFCYTLLTKVLINGVMPRDIKKNVCVLNFDNTVGYVLLNPCPANLVLSLFEKTVDPDQLPFEETI